MAAPGEKIEKILKNCSVDDVSKLLPEETLALLAKLFSDSGEVEAIRYVAAASIRSEPQMLFSQPGLLSLLVANLTRVKSEELSRRLRLEMGQLDDKASYNDERKSKLAGFLGIQWAERTAPIFIPALSVAKTNFGLFPHQRVAANNIWRRIGRGNGRTILHMPTGAGKTRTAMHIVARFLGENEPCIVVWLASSAELLEQASEAFSLAWNSLGNRSVQVMRVWASHEADFSKLSDGILIGGLQKLSAILSRQENGFDLDRLARRVGLTIVDEAHQSIAPTYLRVIEFFTGSGKHDALLGLTATPGRTWSDISADVTLAQYFEEHKVMLEIEGYSEPVAYLMDEGYLARPEFRQLTYNDTSLSEEDIERVSSLVGDYSNDVLQKLATDAFRNSRILAEIRALVDEGHTRIILFAASVEHARTISAILGLYDIASEIVTGDTPKPIRERAIRNFKSEDKVARVMCNFGVLTAGFDAPKTSAAIIARPTRSLVLFSQMVGRATRGIKAGGNKACVISTVVDTKLPGFRDLSEAFTNWEDVYNG